MIRFIVRELDTGAACNVGGPVNQSYTTIDLKVPVLEAFLSESREYMARELVGLEIVSPPQPAEQA